MHVKRCVIGKLKKNIHNSKIFLLCFTENLKFIRRSAEISEYVFYTTKAILLLLLLLFALIYVYNVIKSINTRPLKVYVIRRIVIIIKYCTTVFPLDITNFLLNTHARLTLI